MSARSIEYVSEDGHLTDPADGITVRTNWTASSIKDLIKHLTPVFEETQPKIVLAGFTRRNVDDVEIYVLYGGEEDLGKHRKVYVADEEWMARGVQENRFTNLRCFSARRFNVEDTISKGGLPAVIKSLGLNPLRFRQIYPPLENPPIERP